MESKRQLKFAKLIQKELSDIFLRDAKHILNGAFVTVTIVRVSPDLGLARCYLSFMLAKDPNQMLEHFRSNSKVIKQLLASRIRKQIRVIPELEFYIDDTAEYADKMNRIISGLTIPPADGEEKKEK
jgi:ribosome-binding factor A